MSIRTLSLIALLCPAVAAPLALAQMQPLAATRNATVAAKPRTAAIFVKNRAKEIDPDKVTALEDLIVSRVTGQGLTVLSREDILNAVSSFNLTGPNAGNIAEPGAKLDAILSDSTSAIRLAQNMGADYVLVASITTFGTDVKRFNRDGVSTSVSESTMRVSTRLLDAVTGGALTGDTIEVTEKDIADATSHTERTDRINTLLDKAAVRVSDAMATRLASGQIPDATSAPAKLVNFTVEASLADLAIPEIVKDEQGNYNVQASTYQIQAMSVTVEMDGMLLGSAPGTFQVAPGLHKVRLSRAGCEDQETTVNVPAGGSTWRPAIRMSPEGLATWRANIEFLESMRDRAKKSDAEVKRIEGIAKMFEQSGFRVDIKGDSLWPKIQFNSLGRDGRDGRDARELREERERREAREENQRREQGDVQQNSEPRNTVAPAVEQPRRVD
jgi:hypothetical protein